MEYNSLNLRRIISSIKTQGTKENESLLLAYTETEERIKMVLEAIETEDHLGRFYCLILLQKSLRNSRTEIELEIFLERIEHLLAIGYSTAVEIAKVSSLYSTAAIFYWPTKMTNFTSTILKLISSRNQLAISILSNFLSLVADSLEITEERRYELKRAVGKIEEEISVELFKNIPLDNLLEILLLFNQIEIANERIIISILNRTEINRSIGNFIGNLNINNNLNLFYSILSYLERVKSKISLEFIARNMKLVEKPEIVEIAQRIGREIFERIEELDPVEIDNLLKILSKLFSIKQKNKNTQLGNNVHISQLGNNLNNPNNSGFPIPYSLFMRKIVPVLSRIEGDELKSITESISKIVTILSDRYKEETISIFSAYYSSIPDTIGEILLKNLPSPVYTDSTYYNLKQSIKFSDYNRIISSIDSISLKTSREAVLVREGVELLFKNMIIRENDLLFIYNKSLSIGSYASIDLAVSLGVILERDDLILGVISDFTGRGLIGMSCTVDRCSRILPKILNQFKSHIIHKEGDLTGEIEVVSKILEGVNTRINKIRRDRISSTRSNTTTDRITNQPSKNELNNLSGFDGLISSISMNSNLSDLGIIDIFSKEVVEKIFIRIESGSISEVKKICKIFSYLEDRVHEIFLGRVWGRIKSEIDKDGLNDSYDNSSIIQSIIRSISAECRTGEESLILYSIVETEEYLGRSILVGVKRVLDGNIDSNYYAEIVSTLVSVLVSVYVMNSDENIRGTVVGLMIEKEERMSAMERMYQVDLSEVYAVKEKRPVMKKVLRRIEGMKEKQGALLKKVEKKEKVEDRWAEITTPFM